MHTARKYCVQWVCWFVYSLRSLLASNFSKTTTLCQMSLWGQGQNIHTKNLQIFVIAWPLFKISLTIRHALVYQKYSCHQSDFWHNIQYGGLVRVCTLWVLHIQCESKNPHWGFLSYFPKRLGIFSPNFTRLCTFLFTLDYKLLLNYLQLWRRYAILSASARPPFLYDIMYVHHRPKRTMGGRT